MAAVSALDLSYYHSTDEIQTAFTRLADPSRCGARLTIDTLRDEEDPSFGLKVATFADVNERTSQAPTAKPHVLLNFGAHGRELVSSEVALRLASMLCGEAPSRFERASLDRSRARIAELLRRVVVKMVPVQVPSSRRLAEVGGGSCIQRRLNGRGVDVNRNWDVAWAEGDNSKGSSQYRGPRPFSEPETRALARLADEWHPDLFVDVRSGDRYIAMPYASRASGPTDREDRSAMLEGMRGVTTMLGKAHPGLLAMGGVPYGPASSLGEEPYRATGTALDYMYTKANVRRSYMFEVFGASTVYGVGGRGERGIARTPTAVVSFLQRDLANATVGVQQQRNASRVNRRNASSGTERNESNERGLGHSWRLQRWTTPPHPRTHHPLHHGAARRVPLSQQQQQQQRRLTAKGGKSLAGGRAALQPAFISVAESGGTSDDTDGAPKALSPPSGLTSGLASEERPFDCVAFFNPTSFADYEATVNGWADALLVMINASAAAADPRAR